MNLNWNWNNYRQSAASIADWNGNMHERCFLSPVDFKELQVNCSMYAYEFQQQPVSLISAIMEKQSGIITSDATIAFKAWQVFLMRKYCCSLMWNLQIHQICMFIVVWNSYEISDENEKCWWRVKLESRIENLSAEYEPRCELWDTNKSLAFFCIGIQFLWVLFGLAMFYMGLDEESRCRHKCDQVRAYSCLLDIGTLKNYGSWIGSELGDHELVTWPVENKHIRPTPIQVRCSLFFPFLDFISVWHSS